MIIAIGGGVRTGKTLLMTILGYIASLNGVKVYSTYKTSFSELINPVRVLDFELENCFLLFDETQTFLDSRNKSVFKRLVSYFITQSGKRKVSIFWTSQLLGAVDLRLRDLSHILVFAQKNMKLKRFSYMITDRIRYKTVSMPFEKAKEFYKLYDTYEIIMPLEMDTSDVMTIKDVIELYDDSPTKKSFVMILRKDYPFISYDTASSVYDFVKVKKLGRAKKLLGLP